MQKDLIDSSTWRDLEEEFGGQFVRLAELEDEQKDRLSKEALASGSPSVEQSMADFFANNELACIFRDGPAEGALNYLRSTVYIMLESDMQDEYDAYKDGGNETE